MSHLYKVQLLAVTLTILVVIICCGHMVGTFAQSLLDFQHSARDALNHPGVIATIILLYIVLIAIPFIPGSEIGFALLLMFGIEVAAMLYLATVAALTLSFSVGRLTSSHKLVPAFQRLGLVKISNLVACNSGIGNKPSVRSDKTSQLPNWLKNIARHKVFALALLINTPGNSVIGGGGGIALAAGVCRLLTFREFFVSISVAIAPVPVFFIVSEWLNS